MTWQQRRRCDDQSTDRDDAAPEDGGYSSGWHGCYFLPLSRRATLGADGLPTDTGVLPKMPLPRRMFAGGRFSFMLRSKWAMTPP